MDIIIADMIAVGYGMGAMAILTSFAFLVDTVFSFVDLLKSEWTLSPIFNLFIISVISWWNHKVFVFIGKLFYVVFKLSLHLVLVYMDLLDFSTVITINLKDHYNMKLQMRCRIKQKSPQKLEEFCCLKIKFKLFFMNKVVKYCYQ